MTPVIPVTDYTALIDAETRAFVAETGRYYPADATGLDIAGQRRVYDRMCRAFHAGHPPGLRSTDMALGGVPVRLYETGPSGADPGASVVYFHGGGFVVGGLDSHDDLCAEICAATGFRVINVDYRLAPEHLHPAAFEDTVTALRETAARWPGPLVLAGDSAGATLAACGAHALRGRLAIAGQVLIYGAFGGDVNTGSYLVHAQAPMLSREEVLFYMNIRHRGPAPDDDPTVAPLHDSDFTGLPPSVLFAAECDPLADDSRAYGEAIRAAGGRALWIEEPGLVHGYLRARHRAGRARRSFARIARAIAALGRGEAFPPGL